MSNIESVTDLRKHYVDFGGFSGGWNVTLETFTEVHGFEKMAVSRPVQADCWLTKQFGELARTVDIGCGMCIIVIDNWHKLVKRVNADALRERILVMITGNLFGDNWDKAVRFSGRSDGMIRRSQVGVPVGQPYWIPTEEQLASVN